MKDLETTIGGCMASAGYVLTQVNPVEYGLPLWTPLAGKIMVAVGLAILGVFSTQIKSLMSRKSDGT